MRKVLIKKWIPAEYNKEIGKFGQKINGTGCWSSNFEIEGLFHQWGNSFEELSDTTVQITVAIVELSNGTIQEVATYNMKFVEPLKFD